MLRSLALLMLIATAASAAEPVITASPAGVTVDLADYGQQLRVKLNIRELPGIPPEIAGYSVTLGDKPGPDPDPDPPNPPPPPGPPPAGEFGIAPEIYRLAVAVQSGTRKADCLRLAGECDALAKRIRDLGPNGKPGDVNKALTDIVTVLMSLGAEWDPLKKSAGEKLKEIVVREKLPSSGDLSRWAKLIAEVGVGFAYAGR